MSTSLSANSIKNNNIEDDEFGDASFLLSMDLDAIAAASSENSPNKRQKLPDANKPPTSTTNTTDDALTQTLSHYFGYTSYRTGQLRVIQNVLQRKDVAVFWATGQGKSLLYQMPALHTGQISIVVSPLISLMQDQVHKLNVLSPENQKIATYLGSAQNDANAERDVLRGVFRIVYLTPEKLLQAGFLNKLTNLHQTVTPIGCIAIDEAHCVSEWGHDFRASFRQIGAVLRSSAESGLKHVPLLALTATAVPRVQTDIVSSLHMRYPVVEKLSFDRTNLKIRVASRAGGIATAMQPLLKDLRSGNPQSTIVYTATRKEVEDVAAFLQQNVTEAVSTQTMAPLVTAYHAGMTSEVREEAHTNFLTGRTPVIVSTVAFGMGIDKTDTRRIIHYGPPKTVEEFYQQIGRAGRDGLPAECVMYCNPADFDKYKSDFYLGSLSGQAKIATVKSMDALRLYSLDSGTCRRKALLTYFEETPAFGDHCGTCDVCQNLATYGKDSQRDFGFLGARTILTAVSGLKEQGVTQIIKVIAGNTVEDYRYKNRDPAVVKQAVDMSKSQSSKIFSQDYYKALIPPMVQRGYLAESMMSATISGYSKTWAVYSLTHLGQGTLDSNGAVVLPVPPIVRDQERLEEEKRQLTLARLEAKGIPREKLPESEVLAGDGEVIRAYSKWHNFVERLSDTGKTERVATLEGLLHIIQTWRSDVAVQYRMAPASVLAEHVMVSIGYTQATMPAGMKLDAEALRSVGVRSKEVDSLVRSLSSWVDANQPMIDSKISAEQQMVLDANGTQPPKKWEYAVYKPNKKTGLATWEMSYIRFTGGESPQIIAMSQLDGKQPIQVKTVVGHILEGFVQGRKVDLHRLQEFLAPPTQTEWEQLQIAESTMGMDVAGDPSTSGRNGDKFAMTDLLRPIVGDALADTPFKDRSEAEQLTLSNWFDRLHWYMAFRKVGFVPSFHS